jgi:putative two-component system response regulator
MRMGRSKDKALAAKILVVDDEPAITVALAKKLRREGYDCLTASSGEEALRRLATDEFDLVVTDVRMPGMSGIELLQEIKRRDAEIQVIMMTAYTDIGFAVEALRHKADDYLLKPFNLAELSHSVARSLEHRRLLRENRAFQELAVLSAAAESRVRKVPGHLALIARVATATGSRLGLSGEALKNVWLSAILRDVGMLAVPEAILNKPGPLNQGEWRLVKQHPLLGARLIEGIPYLEPARPGVLHHHEHWDGSGYPSGLAGGEISLEGCILGLADAFAAMQTSWPYKQAVSEADALVEIDRCAGTQFDSRVVHAFHSAYENRFAADAFDLDVPEL